MKKYLEKIKAWWLASSLRQKILILSGSFLALLILVLFISLQTSLWLFYPENLKALIAYNRLGLSAYHEPICHENCFYERRLYKSIIADNLKRPDFLNKVIKAVLNEKENFNFRIELISTLAIANQTAPPEILAYLSRPEANLAIKIALMKNFEIKDTNIVSDLESQVKNLELKRAERLLALDALSGLGEDSLADFYLDLALNDQDIEMRKEALVALSNIEAKNIYFTAEAYDELEITLFESETDKYLRRSIIFLLADYTDIFKDKVLKTMRKIYNDEVGFDKFSRSFAVDVLNKYSADIYARPAISRAEWEEYEKNENMSAFSGE